MRLIGLKWLDGLRRKHADAQSAVSVWKELVSAAKWRNPHDVQQFDPEVSIVGNNRLIFNLRRNRYRIEAVADYERGILLVTWVGTHAEYDRRNTRR